MINNLKGYKPDIAIHPGVTLEETIGALNMSQKELSERTGLTTKTINEIIKGKNPITTETAIKLERVFGVSSRFWNNLELNYQETLARIEDEKRFKEEIKIAERFICYKEMVKLGWIKRAKDKNEKVKILMNFFGVDSLKFVPEIQSTAFRRLYGPDINKESLAAWLRRGEIEASKIETENYDRKKVKEIIPDIKKIIRSNSDSFKNIKNKIINLCAYCGISVAFVPYLKNTYVNGATKWLGPNKALIQLSSRYKYSDIFWFTFFHELGHIVLHGKKEKFIEFEPGKTIPKEKKEEIEADEYARDTLINIKDYNQFIEKGIFSDKHIIWFAKRSGVSPGIIAGRLAHENFVKWRDIDNLRTKIKFEPANKPLVNALDNLKDEDRFV